MEGGGVRRAGGWGGERGGRAAPMTRIAYPLRRWRKAARSAAAVFVSSPPMVCSTSTPSVEELRCRWVGGRRVGVVGRASPSAMSWSAATCCGSCPSLTRPRLRQSLMFVSLTRELPIGEPPCCAAAGERGGRRRVGRRANRRRRGGRAEGRGAQCARGHLVERRGGRPDCRAHLDGLAEQQALVAVDVADELSRRVLHRVPDVNGARGGEEQPDAAAELAAQTDSVMSAPTADERHGARPPAVSIATFFGERTSASASIGCVKSSDFTIELRVARCDAPS